MSIFKGGEEWSSKRTMGIIYLFSALAMWVYKEIKHQTITNPEIFIGIIIAGAGLLGITIFEHFARAGFFKQNVKPPHPPTHNQS